MALLVPLPNGSLFYIEQEEDQASDIIKIGLENELKTSIPVSHTLDKRP